VLSGQNLLAPHQGFQIIIRLGFALFFGALIGWEREIQGKPAGFRTHMLVSLGSALLVLIPIQLAIAQTTPDTISRVIQGITTGIGFLGAGEIFTDHDSEPHKIHIKGLTSAAAIWVSSALGIIAACGLWDLGLIAVSMAWLILRVFKKFE
jgi:putative Mg2+ transporter-C (MgtC) family protein